jgi:DNA mismatch repair protein MutS
MADATTPSMQQYLRAKADHPDCMVLFRMGDFYETFYEDAVEASRVLDLALTSRDKDAENPVPMAGVPWHSVSGYVTRLLEAGKRVAICEQVEDAKLAKGLVRREVVRVITPGVLLDTELSDPAAANHLAVAVRDDRGVALAALDASTGALLGASFASDDDLRLATGRLNVREVLLPPGTDEALEGALRATGALATPVDAPDADGAALPDSVRRLVPPPAVPSALRRAVVSLLSYLGRTHTALLSTVRPMEPLASSDTMTLPPTTVRNLELLSSFASGRGQGSLLHFLDRTRTTMGSRRLRSWLLAPLRDIAAIDRRLDVVEGLVAEPTARGRVRDALSGIPDVERVLTRLAAGSATARDLVALARSARALESASAALAATGREPLAALAGVPDGVLEVAARLESTFVPDPPATTRDGGMVRRGVDPELDEAASMAENGRRYIAEYESRERERTGIGTLKVRYNRVFGYTIEVTRSHQGRVPADYERRQTLTGAERYTTRELTDLERQVSTAEERSRAIESRIFEEGRASVLAATAAFQDLAGRLAGLDAHASLAELAHTLDWRRPRVTPGRAIRIVQGRHPIVEASLPAGSFVPNDFDLDGVDATLTVITGPNMAGKSTIMRQVAITVLLAQTGSFVPAAEAEIGVVDAIWTRVGAMDDLASGRSTFMVEMCEAAEMLSRATDRSLLILDEIGRGTSTFDGVAIAWAVAEHVQARIGCRTLFATHYHELTDLVRDVPRTRNQSVAVKEWGGQVLFLRKLVDGPASKSYGIQVARLAGLPPEVVARAREVLANLEAGELDAVGRPVLSKGSRPRGGGQLDMFGGALPADDPLVKRLAAVDPDRLSPIEALQVLSDLAGEARARRNPGG